MSEIETKSLPESAYRALSQGETYPPIIAPDQNLPELTLRSIVWGTAFCVIFTVAAAYSGLKVGQVMEAAIPVSILTIGVARMYRRRSSLLENVIVTGISGAAGAVVAGAIFTLPALYILKLDPHPVQTIFICLAGGCLGVLFLIPLRRYFVRDMHGLLPYPEATAITEVLVTGERGGSQAKLLLQATAIAGVYDLFVTTFQVWKEYVDFQFLPVMRTLTDRARSSIVALIAFLTLVDLFATQAILPSLARAYRVTPAAMGFAVNATTIGMAVSSLAVALLSQRIDRKLGVVVCLNVESIRQFLSWLTRTELFSPELYFLSRLPAEMDVGETTAVVVMALMLSLLATLYPSWRAARLDPVEALRYE